MVKTVGSKPGAVSGKAKIMNVLFETDGETGTLTDSGAGDVKCDARVKIDLDGTTYYLPLYDTAP